MTHCKRAPATIGGLLNGWLAPELANRCDLPFVALNPAICPEQTLQYFAGMGTDFQGLPYELTQTAIVSYPAINRQGLGVVLLDEGDEFVDDAQTAELFKTTHAVRIFAEGSHRFEHLPESLPWLRACLMSWVNQLRLTSRLLFDALLKRGCSSC